MKFKIDPFFKEYWPELTEGEFLVLEKGILKEGLLENLVVWKEENILLDGHQRLRVLEKHNISYEDRVTFLSFPDRLHAEYWVYRFQKGRRGSLPPFVKMAKVLRFEDIYIEEGKERKRVAGTKKPLDNKEDKSSLNQGGLIETGTRNELMARDAEEGVSAMEQAIYIQKHRPKRFDVLVERARKQESLSTSTEHKKVQILVVNENEKVQLSEEAVYMLPSWHVVADFKEAVMETEAGIKPQNIAVERIVDSRDRKSKTYEEEGVIAGVDAIVAELVKAGAPEPEQQVKEETVEDVIKKAVSLVVRLTEEIDVLLELKEANDFMKHLGTFIKFDLDVHATNLLLKFHKLLSKKDQEKIKLLRGGDVIDIQESKAKTKSTN